MHSTVCGTYQFCVCTKILYYIPSFIITNVIIVIITIIIIKKDQRHTAGREWKLLSIQGPQLLYCTVVYESTLKKKGYHTERKSSSYLNSTLFLRPATPTPSKTDSLRSFHNDTKQGTKDHRY